MKLNELLHSTLALHTDKHCKTHNYSIRTVCLAAKT